MGHLYPPLSGGSARIFPAGSAERCFNALSGTPKPMHIKATAMNEANSLKNSGGLENASLNHKAIKMVRPIKPNIDMNSKAKTGGLFDGVFMRPRYHVR